MKNFSISFAKCPVFCGQQCKRQANDGGGARDRRVMRKSEREVRGHASDEGEQEAGEWWGRARHRRMMGKSKRQARARGRHVVG